MTLVAGVDSSTQSCKVLIVDADTGAVIRTGSAAHPPGTEVSPRAWWSALEQAREAAGGFDDVAAVSVAAQQHGMVCLDQDAAIVRDALLWNDLRSTDATAALLAELPGGPAGWAQAVGSVPVPSFTVTKLRWFAEHEPEHLQRTAAVCLPHDWLTWKLRGSSDIAELTTDRSDASGTGYWSPSTGQYRDDLLRLACGRVPQLPAVLGPIDPAGSVGGDGPLLGCGAGDNAAAALGADLHPGDVLVSLGTSGTACAVHDNPAADPTGEVAGFADATGRFLPLVCTLNATRVFDVIARTLRVDREQLADLALSAPSGAGGVVVVPYWEGERTPDRPTATGAIHGLQLDNTTPANLARAAFEGVLCGLADGIDAIRAQGLAVRQVRLVGGGARSRAVSEIAAGVFGVPVTVLADPEAVATGAARQAAWTLSRRTGPPDWPVATRSIHQAPADVELRERYARARDLTLSSP